MVVRVNGSTHTVPMLTTSDITIFGMGGDDEIFIESTMLPLNIFGESGDDEVILTDGSGQLSDIAAPIAYDGGIGRDFITIWDDLTSATANHTYTFDGGTFARDESSPVTLTSVEDIDLRAQPGDNTIIVQTAPAGIPNYDLYGGFGNDTFVLSAATDDLSSLLSPIEIHGEVGLDAVILYDRNHSLDDTWTVTDFTVGRTGWAGLRYNTSESVIIHAGIGNSTFDINKTHLSTAVSVNAGAGDDIIRLAPATTLLDEIISAVDVNGGPGIDQVELFDNSNTFGDTFTITATSVGRDFFGGVAFEQAEGVALHAGSSADIFDVQSTNSGTPVTINGNGGIDTFNIRQSDPQTPVYVNSGDGNDIVDVTAGGFAIFAQQENLGVLEVSDNGRARIEPGGNTLVTEQLIVTTGGTLDITSNAVIINYDQTNPLAEIRTAVTAGYAGGTWTGSGITSSTAAATPRHAVGYAEASAIYTSFPAVFGGQEVDGTSLLLRYTRYGDANLDGLVNLADFNRLAGSFGSGSLWSQGNFNFDSAVNLLDFNLLAGSFGESAED